MLVTLVRDEQLGDYCRSLNNDAPDTEEYRRKITTTLFYVSEMRTLNFILDFLSLPKCHRNTEAAGKKYTLNI